MSDGEFLWYAGALAAAGLMFLILAVLGLGQGVLMRVVDVLVGLAFLGYAGYLMVVAPDSPFLSWFVFVTPALGLIAAVVARRHARVKIKRLAENVTPQMYAGHDATGHAERQPFPSAPPPLDPSAPTKPVPAHARTSSRSSGPASGSASKPMPSGLPPSGLGERPAEAEPRPPRPSGLPQSKPHAEPDSPAEPNSHAEPNYRGESDPHAEPTSHAKPNYRAEPDSHTDPNYRARHGASAEETAEHDYAAGRHRANGGDREA